MPRDYRYHRPRGILHRKLSRYEWKKGSSVKCPSVRLISSTATRQSSNIPNSHLRSLTSGSVSCRPTPSLSVNKVSSYVIVSIVEGRGASTGEIGIGALDIHSPSVELSQFRDTSSYSRTLVKLLVLNPSEIIVPHSALEPTSCMQKLVNVLQSFRTGCPVIGVQRGRFNDRHGLSDLRRLCHPEYLPAIYTSQERFYALAAASALLQFVEESHAIHLAPQSLKYVFTGSIQTTMIDLKSACRLELVENMRDRSNKDTLYAAVDCTCTHGGARLLRANLLEPPCDLPTTLQRQEAISELATSPETLLAVQNILRQIPYIDGLLSLCVQICTPSTEPLIPNSAAVNAKSLHGNEIKIDARSTSYSIRSLDLPSSCRTRGNYGSSRRSQCNELDKVTSHMSCQTINTPSDSSLLKCPANIQAAESRITRVIAIKSLLDLVPSLHNTLRSASSSLLRTYKELLNDPGYDIVLKKLCTVLHSDVRMSKGMLAMRSQKCFAIKEGINVILDVTRKAYSEQLDDVTAEVDRLTRKHNLSLRVAHNKVRGFYIQLPESAVRKGRKSMSKFTYHHDSSHSQKGPYITDESGDECLWSDGNGADIVDVMKTDPWTNSQVVSQNVSNTNNVFTQKQGDLPADLIKSYCSRGIIHCTSEALIRLNERMKGSLHEIYYIADQIICDLISELHPEMSLFYRLSEVVAGVDLLASFAHLVLSSRMGSMFVYPHFSDRIAIKNGRNITLERQSSSPVIPNHTYTSNDLSLTLLTGPSMSGKSTYLRQIAYLQILAQIGSLLPAEFISIRPTDQIFYHTSGSDDLASNESSFTREMKEMGYLLRYSTQSSLILIDGLCQSTNPQEAFHLSWSICEALLEKKAFTFLATQTEDLTNLAKLYSNVELCHFHVEEELPHFNKSNGTFDNSVVIDGSMREECRSFSRESNHIKLTRDDNQSDVKLVFTYKLLKGIPRRYHYGLELAKLTALPEEVICQAQSILERMTPEMNIKEPIIPVERATPSTDTLIQSSVTNYMGQENFTRANVKPKIVRSVHFSEPDPNTSTKMTTKYTTDYFPSVTLNKECICTSMTRDVQSSAAISRPSQIEQRADVNRHGIKERLKMQLVRQLLILTKLLTHPRQQSVKNSPIERDLLEYIQFLKARYSKIVTEVGKSEE